MKNLRKILIWGGVGILIAHATIAHALENTTYNLLTPLPTSGTTSTSTISTTNIVGYINQLIVLVISLCVVLAVFRITYAGIKWMWARDSENQVKEARNIIQQTLWGLLLIVAAFLLLQFLNPNLLNIGGFLNNAQTLSNSLPAVPNPLATATPPPQTAPPGAVVVDPPGLNNCLSTSFNTTIDCLNTHSSGLSDAPPTIPGWWIKVESTVYIPYDDQVRSTNAIHYLGPNNNDGVTPYPDQQSCTDGIPGAISYENTIYNKDNQPSLNSTASCEQIGTVVSRLMYDSVPQSQIVYGPSLVVQDYTSLVDCTNARNAVLSNSNEQIQYPVNGMGSGSCGAITENANQDPNLVNGPAFKANASVLFQYIVGSCTTGGAPAGHYAIPLSVYGGASVTADVSGVLNSDGTIPQSACDTGRSYYNKIPYNSQQDTSVTGASL